MLPRSAAEPGISDAARHYYAGDYRAAEAICRCLIARGTDLFDAAHLLGVLLLARAMPAEAAVWLRLAVGLRGANAQAWDNLGRACLEAGYAQDALSACQRAVAVGGTTPDRLVNLGNALLNCGDVSAAIARYRDALVLVPMLPPARFNLARAFERQGLLAEAEAELRAVLPLAPPDKRGAVIDQLYQSLVGQGRHDEAAALTNAFLTEQPDAHRTRWNRALVRLALGELDTGWADYESRWLVADHTNAPHGHQVLNLDQVAGRRVLVMAEQGMGDCIQFVRYATLLADHGAEVWLSVPAPLVWLCRTVRGVRGVVALGDPTPPPDRIVSMMSLPLVFGTRLESIPAFVPYLAVPPHACARWRGRVRSFSVPQIGIAWVGSLASASRSAIPLGMLAPLLQEASEAGISCHALVREIAPSDQDALAAMPTVHRHDGAIADFADSAAIVSRLDLVITIDTAMAHLAGALGVPTWVMLPFDADWRWLVGRTDSPWYPTIRLFRQPRPGDWRTVVTELRSALTAWQRRRDRA